MSAKFYAEIEAFDDFTGVADIGNYRQAPDDWTVIIADVQGSTRAIAEGRYKDVNMIGAACINAVLNISHKKSIPYVFGGDGATMMVPSGEVGHAANVLLGVRELAASRFDLNLRVGIVPVAEIHRRNGPRVMVGKYRLSPGNELAVFSGGGMDLAEDWIKSDPAYLVETSDNDDIPDLSGLSCRWEPLASQNGMMLSVLMQATGQEEVERTGLYRRLIAEISAISDDVEAKPISAANMKFRWPPRGLRAEIDLTVGDRNRLAYSLNRYINSLLQWALDRFDLSAGGYRGQQYRVELRDNTDYRRFDDTLRILIDCNEEQAVKIENLLEEYSRQGVLRFGLHRSPSALMTCLVFNLDKGEHIHFVDGGDGGFTAAAKKMKAASRN